MKKNFGFVRVATAIPSVKVADCTYNALRIESLINDAAQRKASLVVFPELSLTGYTCADLFGQPILLRAAEKELMRITSATRELPVAVIVGLPVAVDNRLYNCAAVINKGNILGVVPKTYIPNAEEYYEGRWFAPGTEPHRESISLCGQTVPFSTQLLFTCKEICFGIEICEDLWVPIPPSSHQSLAGANICVNISASNEMVGKHSYRRSLISQQSARTISAYVYCSAGFGESTTDVVFSGNGVVAENGAILAESERFSFEEQLTVMDVDIEKLMVQRRKSNTFHQPQGVLSSSFTYIPFETSESDYTTTPLLRTFTPHPFIPSDHRAIDERCSEIFNVQVNGLAQRINHTGCRSAVVGISGGLDSTLALLVTVQTFDKLGIPRHGVTGITMPGFGTTGRTYNNAVKLMESLGINILDINIHEACLQHFKDIGIDESDRSVTYENAQARERTQILMDIANKTGGMVIGTGDLSELALGWATYNGDHMSMYGVNASVPKTLVKYMVNWVASLNQYKSSKEYLLDIVDTPISPELLPAQEDGSIAQRTEDLVGPYELHDFFLYHFLRFGFSPSKLHLMAKNAFGGVYDETTIKRWLHTFIRRFFTQQFKRSALPDGPKVGSVSLSPRGDWRMPSDASYNLWLDEANEEL